MFEHWRSFLGAALVASSTLAQASPKSPAPAGTTAPLSRVCGLVTPEEAATVLGPHPKQFETDMINQCFYQLEGQSLLLVVRIEERNDPELALAAVEYVVKPTFIRQGYAVQEEPAIGKGAISGQKPHELEIELALKTAVLKVGLRDEIKTIPPDLLDKLRAITKKAASRF